MKAIAFVICVCLGSQLTRGDDARPREKPARPKAKIVDLDFSDDEDPASVGSSGGIGAGVSHPWIYWTLGASAVAGGVTWYWLEARSPATETKRHEQVFTDQRP
jgi:hypothetical protein